MIKQSDEKKERNEQLLKDHESNVYTMLDLVIKYRISPSRIHQIVKRMKNKEAQKV